MLCLSLLIPRRTKLYTEEVEGRKKSKNILPDSEIVRSKVRVLVMGSLRKGKRKVCKRKE